MWSPVTEERDDDGYCTEDGDSLPRLLRGYRPDHLHPAPNGNLVGELPIGTMPEAIGECGTLDRRDGGDPYERAIFVTGSGRRVIVMRMES